MTDFTTSAIMIRRVEYGDADLIITLFTRDRGKISVMAKSAKKSKRRFAGTLEPFSVLDVSCRIGRRGRGMCFLEEATLTQPFPNIRYDVLKTAYASYWAELIHESTEEEDKQGQLYDLFQHVLGELDTGSMTGGVLSILFQIRFIDIAGYQPNLTQCLKCHTSLEELPKPIVGFDIRAGGILCSQCGCHRNQLITLSKGTLKQLLWLRGTDLNQAGRIRFTSTSMTQALTFLECYVPYHLGKRIRSLDVLRRIRQDTIPPAIPAKPAITTGNACC